MRTMVLEYGIQHLPQQNHPSMIPHVVFYILPAPWFAYEYGDFSRSMENHAATNQELTSYWCYHVI